MQIIFEQQAALRMAAIAYSHVLPMDGKYYTGEQYADMIERVYSMDDPANGYYSRVARYCITRIKRDAGGIVHYRYNQGYAA